MYYRGLAHEVADTWDDLREECSESLECELARYALVDWLRSDMRAGEPDDLSGSLWSDLIWFALESVNWLELATELLTDQTE